MVKLPEDPRPVPPGFVVMASTDSCPIAGMADEVDLRLLAGLEARVDLVDDAVRGLTEFPIEAMDDFQIIAQRNLLCGLHLYPQKLINVPLSGNFPWKSDVAIRNGLTRIEARIAGRGRVLLRASGTEPLLRVMVEGEDRKEVLEAAEELAAIVREAAR